MADINLKQVIHNVKEALVTRGVTDTITYGNINQKVLDLGDDERKIINIEAVAANTIKITYEDDTTATVNVEYDSDGKIIKINGTNAVYDGDILVKFGSTDIDIEEIPIAPPTLPEGLAKASMQNLDGTIEISVAVIKN